MKNRFIQSLVALAAAIQLVACSETQEDGRSAVSQNAGSVTISWTPPVARTNGDPLSLAEIRGYRVYYGTESGDYPNRIEINDSTAQQATVENERGFYYFVVTTVDSAGRESTFSEELATNI